MSETKATYTRIGGGSFWPESDDQAGTATIGILKGFDTQKSKFSEEPQKVLVVEHADGSIRNISVSTGLQRAAEQMEVGKAYRITYEGRKKSRRGQPFKSFVVDLIDGYNPDDVVPF